MGTYTSHTQLQRHGASRGLSVTAEFLVLSVIELKDDSRSRTVTYAKEVLICRKRVLLTGSDMCPIKLGCR